MSASRKSLKTLKTTRNYLHAKRVTKGERFQVGPGDRRTFSRLPKDIMLKIMEEFSFAPSPRRRSRGPSTKATAAIKACDGNKRMQDIKKSNCYKEACTLKNRSKLSRAKLCSALKLRGCNMGSIKNAPTRKKHSAQRKKVKAPSSVRRASSSVRRSPSPVRRSPVRRSPVQPRRSTRARRNVNRLGY